MLIGCRVEDGYIVGQLQRYLQRLGVESKPILSFGEGLLGGFNLALHSQALVAEGIGRDLIALLNMQAQEPSLLNLQVGDQLGLGVPDLDNGLLTHGHHLPDGSVALSYVLLAELHGPLGVVAHDGVLDQFRPHVGALRTAGVVDATAAEEIGVFGTVAASADAIGEALFTGIAKDAALEVMTVLLGAFPGHPLFVKQGLHPIEGVFIYKRLMSASEHLLVRSAALVDDPSGVVGITQDALQGRSADFVLGSPLGRPGTQAQAVQLFGEAGERVVAAGVELESGGKESMTLRVEADARYLATIGQPLHIIDVAQPGKAVGAAVFGLLVNGPRDVAAGLHRFVLVVEGKHALHEEGLRRVIADHWLGDGDELRPGLIDQLAGAPVVELVACPAVERPDDHVVNTGGLALVAALQFIQHLQEVSALMQVNKSALAGVGKLADDLGAQAGRFVFGGLTLCADGQAVAVIAGVDLTLGRDPQIDEGPLIRHDPRSWRSRLLGRLFVSHIPPFS